MDQGFKADRRNNEDVEKFKLVHFFTTLSKNFPSQLKFPEKFVRKCLRKELSNISTVSLRGPIGRIWTVELIRKGSEDDDDEKRLYLGKGWEIFVKEHHLKEGDVLFLKYKLGGSVFDVLVFDDENFCEKETSYFVRNCKNEGCHRSNGRLNERKRVEREPYAEISEPKRLPKKVKGKRITSSDDEDEDSGSKTSRLPGRKGKVPASVKREQDSEEEESQVDRMALVLRNGAPKVKGAAYPQALHEGTHKGKPHFVIAMKSTHVSSIFTMFLSTFQLRIYLVQLNLHPSR
ncbi:B3 domain-containing protein Os12g0592300-like isoform X2 [Papaver somniferum]|uniref:B3 domain-containing protein Os12g0592300-like isoform X2 n=1 Tax=Papaver somniferum TaxID=3469 RepID=UPI000E7056AA|nr:B3 domain-containing protein Os12g0592300-like isoform X2 [Papaver somniferum]